MCWGLGLKVAVGDAQVVKRAQLQKPLSVVIHAPDTTGSETAGPGSVVRSDTRVEVTEKHQAVRGWYFTYSGLQLVVECVLHLLAGVEGWRIHAEESNRPVGGVES